ncbi:MAG: hypothetical protein IT477_10450 [Rhodanobacteraceae bacterium]|nr:hypothetical protein [Rhodanobacteraceae bacterium]
MPTPGFHDEWITLGPHRILLHKRCGFPDATLRFVAELAVRTCHNGPLTPRSPEDATTMRVVEVFDDDVHCIVTVRLAVPLTAHEDHGDKLFYAQERATALTSMLQTLFGGGGYHVEVVPIRISEGNRTSDHFHLTEHLSVEAHVAEDRFATVRQATHSAQAPFRQPSSPSTTEKKTSS